MRRNRVEDEDDRPPICPACGVTQGLVVGETGITYICLECGFSDDGGETSSD